MLSEDIAAACYSAAVYATSVPNASAEVRLVLAAVAEEQTSVRKSDGRVQNIPVTDRRTDDFAAFPVAPHTADVAAANQLPEPRSAALIPIASMFQSSSSV